METSPGGPLVVKPTRGELRARVKLLVKKKRSIKRKAQDPPEGNSPALGKVPKLGVFDPRSHAQVQARGQAWSISTEVSEVGVRSVIRPPLQEPRFFEKGFRAPSESPSYLCLGPFGAKRLTFPSDTRICRR